MSQSGIDRDLVIPEGIERIEEEAFAGTGLETVTLPESVTYIADNAFDDDVTFIVYYQSYAEDWAKKNDKAHRVISDSIPEGLYWDIDEEDAARRAYIKGYTGNEEVLILRELQPAVRARAPRQSHPHRVSGLHRLFLAADGQYLGNRHLHRDLRLCRLLGPDIRHIPRQSRQNDCDDFQRLQQPERSDHQC